MSKKRKAETVARQEVCDITAKRAGAQCEAGQGAFGWPCGGPLDTHEIVGRGVRPGAHLEPDITAYVCRTHHSALDVDEDEAYRLGLKYKSHEYDEAVARRARPLPPGDPGQRLPSAL
jgi:hypothetical protein